MKKCISAHLKSVPGGYWRSLKKKEDSKGFTLVELIVVIVILAILAAILIPGLLKWIDQAKDKKYELEAREIAMAAEAALTKMYAQGAGALELKAKDDHYLLKAGDSTDLMKYSTFSGELGKFTDATVTGIEIYGNADETGTWGGSATGFEIAFEASDKAEITARLLPDDDRWVINKSSDGSGGGSDEDPPELDVLEITYDPVTKTVTISGKGKIEGDSLDKIYEYREQAETVVIGDGITGIGGGAFSFYDNLTSITIPSTVTSIGEAAFVNCSSLTGITIPSGVTSIGEAAFGFCSSLTSITIPSGVTSISKTAFCGCTSLESITIPSGVTSIGEAAFSVCSSLTSITIPSGVTSIGDEAFYGCSSLESITIPSGVTSIGEYAFNECSSLTSITIPSGVTSIGEAAFDGCASPKTINFGGTEEQWNALKNGTDIGVTGDDTVIFNGN